MKQAGLQSDKFQLHFGERAINIRAKGLGASEPSVLINRGALCGVMLDALLAADGTSERLSVRFNSKCAHVDLDRRQVTFEQQVPEADPRDASETAEYDLLVGADGVGVRSFRGRSALSGPRSRGRRRRASRMFGFTFGFPVFERRVVGLVSSFSSVRLRKLRLERDLGLFGGLDQYGNGMWIYQTFEIMPCASTSRGHVVLLQDDVNHQYFL